MVSRTEAEAAKPRVKRAHDWGDWVGLAARITLGGVMFYAGLTKVGNLALSVQSVRNYQLPFPDWFESLVGYALPMAELLLGALLIVGLFTRLSAILVTLLMVTFIAGIASAWARGLRIDCGCFSPGDVLAEGEQPQYLLDIVRDTGLVACGAWLAWRPQTPLSLDSWLFGSPMPKSVQT